jgi:hypothetical protein
MHIIVIIHVYHTCRSVDECGILRQAWCRQHSHPCSGWCESQWKFRRLTSGRFTIPLSFFQTFTKCRWNNIVFFSDSIFIQLTVEKYIKFNFVLNGVRCLTSFELCFRGWYRMFWRGRTFSESLLSLCFIRLESPIHDPFFDFVASLMWFVCLDTILRRSTEPGPHPNCKHLLEGL